MTRPTVRPGKLALLQDDPDAKSIGGWFIGALVEVITELVNDYWVCRLLGPAPHPSQPLAKALDLPSDQIVVSLGNFDLSTTDAPAACQRWEFICPQCEYDHTEFGRLLTDSEQHCSLCEFDSQQKVLLSRQPAPREKWVYPLARQR